MIYIIIIIVIIVIVIVVIVIIIQLFERACNKMLKGFNVDIIFITGKGQQHILN